MFLYYGIAECPEFVIGINNENLNNSQKTKIERWIASREYTDDFANLRIDDYATLFNSMSQREFEIFSDIIDKTPDFEEALIKYWEEKLFWDSAYLDFSYAEDEAKELLDLLKKEGVASNAADKYYFDWLLNYSGINDACLYHFIDPVLNLFFTLYYSSENRSRDEDGNYSFIPDEGSEKISLSSHTDYLYVPEANGSRTAHPMERREIFLLLYALACKQGLLDIDEENFDPSILIVRENR